VRRLADAIPLPRPRLLALALLAAIPIALSGLSPLFVVVAVAYLAALAILVALDFRWSVQPRAVHAEREMEPQLSNGAPNRIRIRLRSDDPQDVRLRVRDDAPVAFDVDRRTHENVVVPGRGETAVDYFARPRHRGTFRFGDVHLRMRTQLDLAERQWRAPLEREVKVYPNLLEIRRYEISVRRGLAYDAGLRRARIPGAGTVFERLREYVQGDDPRQISWTATARRGRPITVEYEVERQQRVLILLDVGRMMASTIAGLTKLDHVVNTALMLAFVATTKGDEVGLLAYADAIAAYVPPRRGKGQFRRITEELRRLEPELTEPDHRAALAFLRQRSARRALVVLFTDLIDEDASRALLGAIVELAGSNLVLCVALADPQVGAVAASTPRSSTALYEKVVASEVVESRARVLAMLQRRGVHTIDVPAEQLTVATIQRYLELKRRALL
jgi:uncharacterized protein (DUF58 family)